MKCLTVRQPYASLVAAGVKTIETRSWRTAYRGRIAVHAGREWDRGWLQWIDPDGPEGWKLEALDNIGAYAHEDVYGSGAYRPWRYGLPRGAVVATAELVDCVPIVGSTEPPTPDDLIFRTIDGRNLFRQQTVGDPEIETNVRLTELTDQIPFGVFEPGRWGWLFDDIAPTTERCPACWGDGVAEGELLDPRMPCPVCGGRGSCDPVPARGRQGLWGWEP